MQQKAAAITKRGTKQDAIRELMNLMSILNNLCRVAGEEQ